MLRWTGLSGFICIVSMALGLGKVVHFTATVESLFLIMAALAATVMIGSYDAYETQGDPRDAED